MGTFVLLPQFITDITAWLNIIVTTKLTNSCFCNKIKWSHVMCHIEPRELFGRNIFHLKMTSSACDSSLFLTLCESNFSHVKNIDSNKLLVWKTPLSLARRHLSPRSRIKDRVDFWNRGTCSESTCVFDSHMVDIFRGRNTYAVIYLHLILCWYGSCSRRIYSLFRSLRMDWNFKRTRAVAI